MDDPRNTDNAWMETVAVNLHDESGINHLIIILLLLKLNLLEIKYFIHAVTALAICEPFKKTKQCCLDDF